MKMRPSGYNVHYWARPGKQNTIRTLKLAVARACQLQIDNYVVASCRGYTTRELVKLIPEAHIVSVTHQAGFHSPGKCEMPVRTARFLEKHGVSVYTGTHFFGGVGRAIRMKFGGLEIDELVAQTLRIFGQGIKVTVEIAVMALDAGLIPFGKEIIAIGGTGQGADTAVLCLPAHGKDIFSFEIREIICKPRTRS